jgi:ADP-L-glycero-D-manno-heptose 6-epimerase
VRRLLPERTAPVVGFRYFNVYGPRERHKGRMASVVLHFFDQYRADGRVRLFEGAAGYAAGEQRRDFVSIEDVAKVNLDFLGRPDRSGIFNLGTGQATTYNELARATINAARRAQDEPELSLADLVAAGAITYVPFPPALAGKYQSHTQADLARLRAAGYRAPMLTVAEGVPRYVERLISEAASSA